MELFARRKALVSALLLIGLVTAACGRAQPTAPPAAANTPLPTVAPSPTPAPAGLAVPLGPPPQIDGVLDPGEWDNALGARLSDGSTLLLMQDGSYLYLAVRALVSDVGVTSVCLDRGQQIAILHASAALGTAIYEVSGESWEPIRTFSWSCRGTDDSAATRQERQSFLEREGWVASNGNMGVPGQIEFQIAMPAGSLRLSVAYSGPLSQASAAWWPQGQADDCRQITLVHGDTPGELQFDPETWTLAIPDPTPLQVERLQFLTPDGITLTGSLFRGTTADDAVVLLAHMGGRDQRDWEEFARLLAREGLAAFALDFRCHGQSACDASTDQAHLADLRSALALLRERGYRRIACVGASLGAGACARAALFEELAGLAFLGGPDPGTVDGRQYPQDLVSPEMPKLFVVTEYDRYSVARTAVRDLYNRSPEPRALRVFPGTAHGTDMFAAEYGSEFRDLLAAFLREALR